MLEFESGSNDPMAVFLTIGAITPLLTPGSSGFALVPLFFQQMAVGGIVGYGMRRGMVYLVTRVRREFEGLYPVFTLQIVLMPCGMTAAAGGSGFLFGLHRRTRDGHQHRPPQDQSDEISRGDRWLMQTTLFLSLGLLVFPARTSRPSSCRGS